METDIIDVEEHIELLENYENLRLQFIDEIEEFRKQLWGNFNLSPSRRGRDE